MFTELAAKHGLVTPGDKLDTKILEFAIGVADPCARIAGGYCDAESGGNASGHTRARLTNDRAELRSNRRSI